MMKGQLAGLMKQAQQMQDNMKKAQEQLASVEVEGQSGAGMVKVDAAAEMPEIVEAITGAGIPVWAQFGITPHSQDARTIRERGESVADFMAANAPRFVEQAQRLERAGAAMLDFTNSGPVAGAAVAGSVAIPVIGGLGGGPWLDGRVRLAHTARGAASQILAANAFAVSSA